MNTLNHRFRVALAELGISKQDAAKQLDVTPSHLYRVLRGQRASAGLVEKIESMIASTQRQTA